VLGHLLYGIDLILVADSPTSVAYTSQIIPLSMHHITESPPSKYIDICLEYLIRSKEALFAKNQRIKMSAIKLNWPSSIPMLKATSDRKILS
jgi:hypothetical protein